MVHFVIGILNLELSWRGVAGSMHNKLDWAQILANKKGLTLTIADSTLATGSSCPTEGDLEQGRSMNRDLSEQWNAYLHIDAFRMDQVIRNMITNAVWCWHEPYFPIHCLPCTVYSLQTKFTPAGGSVQVNISCELQNQENRNKLISKVCYYSFGIGGYKYKSLDSFDA